MTPRSPDDNGDNAAMRDLIAAASKEKLSKEMTTRVAVALAEYKKSLSATLKHKKKMAKFEEN
eukprot:8580070-Karenia_brevis.AAC.1